MKNYKFTKILSLALVFALILCLPLFSAAKAEEASAESSDGTTEIDTTAELEGTLTSLGNNYPIVLVHGLFGWGDDEVSDLYYWGGKTSIRAELEESGYTVYSPTIGPVASNWDRACELYAYLIGGTVDYGKAHAENYGHDRYGRTYPGVLPELNDPGSTLKIHLVGHSMGGETIRMLAQLLENGDPDEITATTDGSISPLFTGECRHWIESITTICTPHDGSQYDNTKEDIEPFTHRFIAALAAATGANINDKNFKLDFKLDQWGLEREPGESYESYFNRVMSSEIWEKTTDLSVYDLDTDGAAVLNAYAKAQPDIYYFSISCSDTYATLLFPYYHNPYTNINHVLKKSSIFMGRYVNYDVGHVQIDSTWWENDGIVSVRSAVRPHSGSTDPYNENYGTSEDGTYVFKDGTLKGTWNYLEEIEKTDHLNIVCQSSDKEYLRPKFFQIAAMLESIPD